MGMKGVSLVALIITIIVLIILTATVIIVFKYDGIIDKAKQASFRNDITVFREELLQYVLNKQVETLNTFDKTTLTKITYNEIKEIIKSFTQKYENKVIIYKGEIAVDITKLDEKETEWAEALNLSELSSSISNGIVPNEAKAIKNYRIYGNSVQDGTPTPINPVEVVSLGEDGEVNVVTNGKNLLLTPYISGTGRVDDGATFAVNNDGSMDITGNNTGSAKFVFVNEITLPAGNYIASGNSRVRIYGDLVDFPGIHNFTNGVMLSEPTTYSRIYCVIIGLGAIDEIIFPQLEIGTEVTNYETYQEITTTIDLTGHEPLRRIGDVADYIDYESGKIVRCVGKIELTGENDERWNLSQTSTYSYNLVSIANPDIREEFKCNYYEYSIMYNTNCFWIDSSGKTLRITSMQHLSTENFKNWIAEQYSKEIPVIVYYKLKKSIEEDIVLPKLPDNAKQINVMPSGSVQPSNVEIEYYM